MKQLTLAGKPVDLVFEREFANGRMLMSFKNGNVWIVPEPATLGVAVLAVLFTRLGRPFARAAAR